ncbi:MAG: acyl-CoA dehydrogenase, partial [Actinobacteria bacterium]|nr:acyl-CoA dehydrogenase [Actinomycetota bacterium]
MSNNGLPEEVEELRIRTRAFIRTVIMEAEPAPGHHLTRAKLVELQVAAKAAGVFAPQVSKEFGGQGVPIQYWSSIFQEIGYSPI